MFEKDINTAILQLNRWFNSNLLLLNLEKTYFLQFLTKNTNATDLHIIIIIIIIIESIIPSRNIGCP